MDWIKNLKMNYIYKHKEYVRKNPIPEIEKDTTTLEKLTNYNQHVDDATNFTCIMISTMSPDLQKSYEDYWPYKMNLALTKMFHKKARQERYKVMKAFMASKLKEWEFVCAHVQKMKRHIKMIEKLNVKFYNELAIDMVLNSLPSSYDQFILTYPLNNIVT